jgi:lycopene beta-cyclase
MKHYDYIFTGAGLSALMTVNEMMQSGQFETKNLLLIDAEAKQSNDRTWCFWDTQEIGANLVHKKWDFAKFIDSTQVTLLDLSPYRYQMVTGQRFYETVFEEIKKHKNITFLQEKITDFHEAENQCVVQTEKQSFTCHRIFNSIYKPEIVKQQNKYPVLQQHFIGWFIKSKQAVFNPEQATFMDFSVEQKGNTRFMYVLPTTANEALLEYTLFSHHHLKTEAYENEIQNYLQKLGITDYEITAKEQGSIPMTCYPFWKQNTKNIIHIGSAGGWTKASTGYTFKSTLKKSKRLVDFLLSGKDFRKFHKRNKFWFYDLLLLDILDRKNEMGTTIFSSLFQKGSPTIIFKFLDEETSFLEDLKVIWKCPKGLFIAALFRVVFRMK